MWLVISVNFDNWLTISILYDRIIMSVLPVHYKEGGREDWAEFRFHG